MELRIEGSRVRIQRPEQARGPRATAHRSGRSRTKSRAALAVAAALLFACAACKQEAVSATPLERPPAAVAIATAIAQDVPVYLDEIGKCTASETVSIRAQVSGRITAIHFVDGADLERGALLLTIDPRPYEAHVARAEADVAHDRAVLELARTELARIESLGDSRAMSKHDRDVRRNAVEVAEAKVKASEAALELARVDLDRCTIRSPIDGRAGRRLVDLGNVVDDNGDTALLVIQKLDPIYADFSVTESELPLVRENLAGGTLAVEVRLPDDPGDPRRGELSFIDTAVQASTGTVRLRATIANADRRFWPGQFIDVRLVLRVLAGAVLVPVQAVQKGQQGPFVYVVRDDATAELRPIATGQRHGERIVIEKGVRAGEKVITIGQIAVMPGGKVRVVQPDANS